MRWLSRFAWFADASPWVPNDRPVYIGGRLVTLGLVRRVAATVLPLLMLAGGLGFVTLALVVGNPPPACVSEKDPTMGDEAACLDAVDAWCAQYHPSEQPAACELDAYGIKPPNN